MAKRKRGQYYFNLLRKSYTFPRRLLNAPKRDWVRGILNDLKPGARILDAGCGGGDITRPLAARYRLVGVDIENEAVDHCRQQALPGGDSRYIQADLSRLPFASGYFDAVVFCNAIEHLEDTGPVLKEITRVMKKGAVLLCTTENCSSWLWVFAEHTWYRCFGGNCKPYSPEVHPQRFTLTKFRACVAKFLGIEELFLGIAGIEMFMVATKE